MTGKDGADLEEKDDEKKWGASQEAGTNIGSPQSKGSGAGASAAAKPS